VKKADKEAAAVHASPKSAKNSNESSGGETLFYLWSSKKGETADSF
jgi:hypothetical protein